MNSLKVVILGIAFIIFGGVCLAVNEIIGIGEFFEVISVFSPFAGIALSIIGTFMRD